MSSSKRRVKKFTYNFTKSMCQFEDYLRGVREIEENFKVSFRILAVVFLCKQEPPLGSLYRTPNTHNKTPYFNQDSDCSH